MEDSMSQDFQGYDLDWRMEQYVGKDREAVLLLCENAMTSASYEAQIRILWWADGLSKDENIDTIFDDWRKRIDSIFIKIRELKRDCIVFTRNTLPKTAEVFHFAGCSYIKSGGRPLNVSEAVRRGLDPCELCGIEFVS